MPQSTPTPAIYSQNLKTKGKTYFFDVKQAKNGSKYVSISESWIKDGQKHRGSITVFSDMLTQFAEAFSQVQDQAK